MPAWRADLRSDTVTRPTHEMRRAMYSAEVGDDQYGEDPTVRALEEAFAARLGKPSAVFVPSGTMANQLALRVLTDAGDAVVAGSSSHIVAYEHGAGARNAGVLFSCSDDADGSIPAAGVRRAILGEAHHLPHVGLVSVEDTHMAAGGRPWDIDALREVAGAARQAAVPVHLDGARLWNAEVATGVTVAERAAQATTVMCCLSKGLCAPVGSLLAGPEDVISEARSERHRLGGSMRQAGVLAAAGLVALGMVQRLADDHRRAARLGEVVAERWPHAPMSPVSTNLVVFQPPDADGLLEHLAAAGVAAGTIGPGVVRLVTHHDVDDEALEVAVAALASAP